MRIQEGNIFEAMRLVLPEHRESMLHFERELRKLERPCLEADKQSDMHYILTNALSTGRQIRITLFDPYEDDTREGVPIIKNGKLFLTKHGETWPIAREQIVDIEEI